MPCLGQSCQIYYFKNQIGYRTNVSARYTADEPIIPLHGSVPLSVEIADGAEVW